MLESSLALHLFIPKVVMMMDRKYTSCESRRQSSVEEIEMYIFRVYASTVSEEKSFVVVLLLLVEQMQENFEF